ncbi:MAG: hypothetical protein ACFCVC_11030 [Acidimicrobiia bacterium]
MVYKGRLKVAGDPGEGIPVDLSIDDVFVDLASGDENLGRWRMDVVDLSRLAGNEFALSLDGEQMVFVAADPLGFAYNAVTTIEEISGRLRKKRGLFRKRSDASRKLEDDSVPTIEVVGHQPSTDLDDLLPSTPDLSRLLPPPVGRTSHREVLPPPGGGEARAEATEVMEAVEEVEGVDWQVSDDIAEVETLEPGGVEPLEPLPPVAIEVTIDDVPELVEVEGLAETDDVENTSADGLTGVDVTIVESIDEGAAAPATGSDATCDPADEGFDLVEVEPVELIPSGSADAVEDPEPAEIVHEVVDGNPPIAHEASCQHASGPLVGDGPNHPAEEEPREPAETPPAPPAPTPPASEGTPSVAPAPAPARRRRFGRSRAEEAHVHDYAESKTVGGITRRVCAHCGHVSFAGEDVYQEWK